MNTMIRLFQQACKVSPQLKHSLWRLFYQYLVRMDRDNEMIFMNYGYAYLDGNRSKLVLADTDKKHLFCIQLYHYVTSSMTLSNSDVLDVGCGRGGGPSFIARYLGPRKMVGLDFSKKAVDFCTRHYSHPTLSFSHGNAEILPFAEESFDYILNIESSRCYSSMAGFLGQVRRVLRPDGCFLFADFRHKDEIPALEKHIAASGMKLVAWKWITENVYRALDLDHDRKSELLRKKAPPLMTGLLADFIGTRGSSIYRLLESRENEYIHCVLQKT
jgi:ubiquinone/menaquinone biosynthesis C-methylase UbiE